MFYMFFAGWFVRAAIEALTEERYGLGIFYLIVGVADLFLCWSENKENDDGGWI